MIDHEHILDATIHRCAKCLAPLYGNVWGNPTLREVAARDDIKAAEDRHREELRRLHNRYGI